MNTTLNSASSDTTTNSRASKPEGTNRNRAANRSQKSSFGRMFRFGSAALAAAALLTASPRGGAEAKTTSAPVKNKTTTAVSGPATGRPCQRFGSTARAGGARFDCVSVGATKQWQLRGSRHNPFGLDETATVGTADSRWKISVYDVEDNFTAELTSGAPGYELTWDDTQFVGVFVRLTYLGPDNEGDVRDGIDLRVFTPSDPDIVRAYERGPLDYDCWADATVAAGTTKECVMPFEVRSEELSTLGLFVADANERPTVFIHR